jgi:hypothetical protein
VGKCERQRETEEIVTKWTHGKTTTTTKGETIDMIDRTCKTKIRRNMKKNIVHEENMKDDVNWHRRGINTKLNIQSKPQQCQSTNKIRQKKMTELLLAVVIPQSFSNSFPRLFPFNLPH